MSRAKSNLLPGHVPLLAVSRGGRVENVHYGSIAAVDRQGELRFSRGDMAAALFGRSCLKPFQALPLVEAGGLDAFGLGEAHAALTCASHSGEEAQVAGVAEILARAGNRVEQLQCGCHVPLRFLDGAAPAGTAFTALHHNCSGKHAGFLAACRHAGWPVESYLERDHPLQRRIGAALGAVAGADIARAPVATDGCSAPNWALPAPKLALAYARLAGAEPGTPLGRLFAAMTRHPEMVSGEGRFDLALARLRSPGDWVAKAGADGLQAFASREAGLGVLVKIADGNPRALQAVTLALLTRLGLLREDELPRWRAEVVTNIRGLAVGERRVLF